MGCFRDTFMVLLWSLTASCLCKSKIASINAEKKITRITLMSSPAPLIILWLVVLASFVLVVIINTDQNVFRSVWKNETPNNIQVLKRP